MRVNGRIIKLGDHIDTDVLFPAPHLIYGSDKEKIMEHALEYLDEKYKRAVRAGASILVAGKNFGCGSSREQAALAVKYCGIRVCIAETIGRIFYRNAVNVGLPVLICPGISKAVNNGDELEVDVDAGKIRVTRTGETLSTEPMPGFMQNILKDGGLIPHLRKELGD